MTSPAILINSGRYFDFAQPTSNRFCVDDIAHALSHICRFGGHCREFYSVAQHSVMVSAAVPPEFQFAALMHDAAEAFLGDVPTPLKRLLPDYAAIERQIEEAVLGGFFGITLPLPPAIKAADMQLLATEKRDLMPETLDSWPCLEGIEPLCERIWGWEPKLAKTMFVARYEYLREAAQ